MDDPQSERRRPKLLEQLEQAARARNLSPRTVEAYRGWVRRYVRYHGLRHPRELGAPEINAFLTDLAVRGNVSRSTQSQALSALLFLYRHLLETDPGELGELVRPKPRRRQPVILDRDEIRRLFDELRGVHWLVAALLYGGGLRLLEALNLRVKDIDFTYRQLVIRDGKGNKDRITVLPDVLVLPLREQLQWAKKIHQADLEQGGGRVSLPHALARNTRVPRPSGAGSGSSRPAAQDATPPTGVSAAGT